MIAGLGIHQAYARCYGKRVEFGSIGSDADEEERNRSALAPAKISPSYFVKSITSKPSTRQNSFEFAVTSVLLWNLAVAAIQRSLVPIMSPRSESSLKIEPYSHEIADSHGRI